MLDDIQGGIAKLGKSNIQVTQEYIFTYNKTDSNMKVTQVHKDNKRHLFNMAAFINQSLHMVPEGIATIKNKVL